MLFYETSTTLTPKLSKSHSREKKWPISHDHRCKFFKQIISKSTSVIHTEDILRPTGVYSMKARLISFSKIRKKYYLPHKHRILF